MHAATNIKDVDRRLKALERQQAETLENNNNNPVQAFLKDQLKLGGFFQPAFTSVTGPATATQVTNSVNLLGINLGATLAPQFRFASQFLVALGVSLTNPHNDPQATSLSLTSRREFSRYSFAALVTQGYLEADLSTSIRLQVGTGYVPFGRALQQREPVLFLRQQGPQIGRTSSLLSPFWNGLHLYGLFHASREDHWGYNFYTFAPVLTPKILGPGGRIWRGFFEDKLTAGLSTQVGKRGADTDTTVGTDVRINSSPVAFTAEYARRVVASGADPWTAYLEPAVSVGAEEWILFGTLDYIDDRFNKTGGSLSGISDPIKKWEYGGGVNWLPTSLTRFRLEMAWNNYVGDTSNPSGQDRDYLRIDGSVGVSF